MKQLERLAEPNSFFKDDCKVEFYKDLRDEKGKIKARWNLKKYRSDIAQILLLMSNNECAYCGKKIDVTDFDVEHYLPKEKFPYLAYCFDNYLASCKECNQNRKRSFYPISLDDLKGKIAEEVLIDKIDNLLEYKRDSILNEVTDRIVEPTFDKVVDHLQFEPCSGNYLSKSEIGVITNRIFFEHREFVSKMQKLSEQVRQMIMEKSSKEVIMGWAELYGHSYYLEIFYDFWNDFYN